MIKYIPFRRGMVVLDGACDGGLMLERLLEVTASPWSVGTPPVDLAHVAPGRAAETEDGALPFAAETFDALLSKHALGRSEGRLLLVEAHRVLRPGGWLIGWEKRRAWRAWDGGGGRRALDEAGFVLRCQEPFDLLADRAAAILGRVPGISHSLAARAAVQGVFALDGLLLNLPALRRRSRHVIWVARKGP